ncbi:MAG: hypothetical protein ACLQPD_01280 [Desulfomonilaceae bacterium]
MEQEASTSGRRDDPHLRSTRQVTGYHIHATDGEIGHVEDFIVNDENWAIRFLVVDTRNWLPGKKVLLSPQWIKRVEWADSSVYFDLTRESVRNSPEFDFSKAVNRDYEAYLLRPLRTAYRSSLKGSMPFITLFVDRAGVLLTNGWEHQSRESAAKRGSALNNMSRNPTGHSSDCTNLASISNPQGDPTEDAPRNLRGEP